MSYWMIDCHQRIVSHLSEDLKETDLGDGAGKGKSREQEKKNTTEPAQFLAEPSTIFHVAKHKVQLRKYYLV